MQTSRDEPNKTSNKFKNFFKTYRQIILYLLFAVFMILLNILLQYLHREYIVIFIQQNFGSSPFIQQYYLSTNPYNMPELIGSAIAVLITYLIKFILDKYIVFQKRHTNLKQTSKEFIIYFILAIITTLENIGIQFLLGIWTPLEMYLRIIIALSCGYITKFFLDRKFCFQNN